MRPISTRHSALASEATHERLLLVTKLAAPQVRADLTPRPRLADQLYHGLQCPLTLIAAPAGFGKTTLLSTWFQHAPLQAAWVSLEPSDNDLTRFWSYTFNALERIQPGSGSAGLALLEGSHLGPPPPIETVVTAWINGLATLPRDVALVLDDYHLITTPAIHRAVSYLLDHLPSQLHLVIATRADPPLPLARLRARGHLAEIRAADLRFTSEETLAFLTQSLGSTLSVEDSAALEARTEGWIAGLQLAVLSMRGRADPQAFLATFSGSHRYIVDYLVQEVLARQPKVIQTFLLHTAILERLEASLCEAVLGKSRGAISAQAMLEQAAQANLFLTPLDEERRWYRYHPLFGEALRHRLELAERTLIPELHRRASRWYETHNLASEAIHHALAAGDFDNAARLIENAAEHVVKRGELVTLRTWLDALPSDLVHSRSTLCLWQAWVLVLNGQHEEAEGLLLELERASDFSASHSPLTVASGAGESPRLDEARLLPDSAGRIAAIRAYSAFRRGDARRVIEYAHQALALLPHDQTARGLVAWNLGVAYLWNDDFAAAATTLTEARDMSQAAGNSYASMMAAFELAQTQARQGRLTDADRSYQHALDLGAARNEGLAATGPMLVGRGDIQREWNQLDLATETLREGISRCQHIGNIPILLLGYVTLARVKQAQGNVVEARALMRMIERLLHANQLPPINVAVITAWQMRLALAQGDIAQAERWAQERPLRADDELSASREVEYHVLARVLLARRRIDAALSLLERLLRLAEKQGRMGSALETLVLQAVALQAAGDEASAVKRLTRTLSLAEPEGYIRLFIDEGTPMARLLALPRARRERDSAGYIAYGERLLALLRGASVDDLPHSVVAGSSAYPLSEALSERELAVLRLIVAGYSNQDIADHLVLALSTVKWYINVIYGKLQVQSRTKAIARARDLMIL